MTSIAIGKQIEILLVEDDAADATRMRLALDQSDIHYNLHVMDDGEQALDFLRKEGSFQDAAEPDLALVDISLPKMDGLELLAEIRSNENLRHLPVVILTGSQDPNHVRRANDLQANLFITKSETFDGFAAVMDQVFKVIDLSQPATRDD